MPAFKQVTLCLLSNHVCINDMIHVKHLAHFLVHGRQSMTATILLSPLLHDPQGWV